MNDCLFCRIISKEIPSYRIYEDENHIAFLDIFPAVRGQSLVIPKIHASSYVFEMDEKAYSHLMLTTRKVASLIDRTMGALRTCMVIEGMEIDHAHIKLYPIYTVVQQTAVDTIDLNEYHGYLSTLHGSRMLDSELEAIAKRFS